MCFRNIVHKTGRKGRLKCVEFGGLLPIQELQRAETSVRRGEIYQGGRYRKTKLLLTSYE